MKILALTFGDHTCASTWYRILQYENYLRNDGIQLLHDKAKDFKDFKSLKYYDAVILQKAILSIRKTKMISKSANRLIYDADDIIWTRPVKPYGFITKLKNYFRMKCIAMSTDICTVANHVIESELKSFGAKTSIVKMGLDATYWKLRKPTSNSLSVGWTGAPKNFSFIEKLIPALINIQKEFPSVNFIINSGKDPQWKNIKYEYLPFIKGNEPNALKEMSIGLLPLPDNRFTNGKSPIKALQYFATGTAVVCSHSKATDDYKNLCLYANSQKDWEDTIRKLINDENLRNSLAAKGREFFEQNYEISRTYQSFKDSLMEKH